MFRACNISAFKIWSFVVGLGHPVEGPALVLNVCYDLKVDSSFGVLSHVRNTSIDDAEQLCLY